MIAWILIHKTSGLPHTQWRLRKREREKKARWPLKEALLPYITVFGDKYKSQLMRESWLQPAGRKYTVQRWPLYTTTPRSIRPKTLETTLPNQNWIFSCITQQQHIISARSVMSCSSGFRWFTSEWFYFGSAYWFFTLETGQLLNTENY